MLNSNRTGDASDYVSDLVYELLDAHLDTIRLATEADEGIAWAAHIDYLRDLQRVGHEALARLSGPPL